MDPVLARLAELRALGVVKATFHADGSLASAEFGPEVLPEKQEDQTQRNAVAKRLEQDRRNARRALALGSSGGPVRRVDAEV